MIKTGSRKHSNSRRIADECRAQVEVNEGGFADCAKHCAEMKLRAEDLEEWIANLALTIRARDLRFGERADSNAFPRCTALDVVKERTVHEIESRGKTT